MSSYQVSRLTRTLFPAARRLSSRSREAKIFPIIFESSSSSGESRLVSSGGGLGDAVTFTPLLTNSACSGFPSLRAFEGPPGPATARNFPLRVRARIDAVVPERNGGGLDASSLFDAVGGGGLTAPDRFVRYDRPTCDGLSGSETSRIGGVFPLTLRASVCPTRRTSVKMTES